MPRRGTADDYKIVIVRIKAIWFRGSSGLSFIVTDSLPQMCSLSRIVSGSGVVSILLGILNMVIVGSCKLPVGTREIALEGQHRFQRP